jgi:hypothetical protein
MQKGLLLLLVLLMLGVIVGLVVVEQRAEETGGILGSRPEPEVSRDEPVVSPGGAIPEGWQRYELKEGAMSLWYPGGDGLVETPEGGVRLNLRGETQTDGTELFDGIMVTIDAGTYENESFQAFVRSEYELAAAEPSLTQVGGFGEVNIAGRNGYRFVVEGLGTFTRTYIPLDTNRFALLTYMVADPEGRDYQGMVEVMLKSISYG